MSVEQCVLVIMSQLKILKDQIYSFARKAVKPPSVEKHGDACVNSVNAAVSCIFNKQSSSQPKFSGSQVRLVLYRDQDFKGRSLLFDSKAVHRVDDHDTKGNKKKATTEESGLGGPPLPKYSYSRPGSDTKMLEEMSFGAVGMAFRGSTLKVHTIRTPPQLMVTKVFVPTLHRAREPGNAESESLDCSLNYSSSELAMPQKISTNPSDSNPSIAQSVPMDVPSPQTRSAYSDNEHGDSGFSTSAASSLSSLTTSIPRSSSSSSLNSSSYNSMTRRWRRSQQTSLEHSLLKRQSDEGVYEQPLPSTKRPWKVGLVVVISLSEDDEENARLFQNFFFSHITLIECHMDKLKLGVERAMSNRKLFVHLMVEALDNFRRLLVDLYLTPRLPEPVWLNMMCFTTQRVSLCHRFLREFMVAVTKYDTKQTKFFLSTLLTVVLTNHLAWVPTVTPAGATTSRSYTDKHSANWLDAVAKSHPYNPLWAQLGDLYGALGFPLRLTRTVVVGKKTDVVNRFLYILSYFIRCSEVLERTLQSYDFEDIDVDMAAEVEAVAVATATDEWSERSTESSPALLAPHSICPSKCTCGAWPAAMSGMVTPPLVVCAQCRDNRTTLVGDAGDCTWPNAAPAIVVAKGAETEIARVKLKRCSVSRAWTGGGAPGAEAEVPGIEACALAGIVFPANGGAAGTTWPLLQSRTLNSKRSHPNVITQVPIVLACMPVVQPPIDTTPPSPSASAMPEHHSAEMEAVNAGPEVAVEGEKEVVMCRMSPTSVNEERSTERVRHVGRQASERASTSPVSGLQLSVEGEGELVIMKGETPQVDAGITKELSASGSDNDSDNGEDSRIAATTNCNVANDIRTDPQEAGCSSKCEHLCDNGIYDVATQPAGSNCDTSAPPTTPPPEPSSDSKKHSPHSPTTDAVQEPQAKMTPSSEKLYRLPPSFDHSNSMFDEYFTEDSEDVAGSTMLPHERYKRMGSIEGTSSLFDEYMNAPCPEMAWMVESSKLDEHPDYPHDMFDEYFSSTDSTSRSSVVDDGACEAAPFCMEADVPGAHALPDCSRMIGMNDCDGMSRPRHFSNQSTVTLTPSRTRSTSPTDLRCRHASSLSTTSSIGSDFFSSLKEVNMHACDEIEECVSGPQSFQRNFGRSLLAGTSPHYLSDFVLHGTTDSNFQAALHHDLTMTVKNSVLDEQISEAVCIVADIDNWTVKVQKCHYDTSDRVRTQEVAASPLICNIMESVHNLWKLKMSPEFCLMHLEDRLQEIYFKSHTLAELLRLHKRMDLKQLAAMLNFDVNDIPLLMAVAGTHTPLMAMALL